jgi:hypothetical protein
MAVVPNTAIQQAQSDQHGRQPSEDEKRDLQRLWETAAMHAEDISWSRFYNFLMVNSILILAWATIYSASLPLPAEKFTDQAKLVLVSICLLGIASGLVGSVFGFRGRRSQDRWLREGMAVDSLFLEASDDIRHGPLRFYSSFWLHIVSPVLVSVLYAILLIASLSTSAPWWLICGSPIIAILMCWRYKVAVVEMRKQWLRDQDMWTAVKRKRAEKRSKLPLPKSESTGDTKVGGMEVPNSTPPAAPGAT